jgi:hypothetical protein
VDDEFFNTKAPLNGKLELTSCDVFQKLTVDALMNDLIALIAWIIRYIAAFA